MPDYPPRRYRLVRDAAAMVNSREFISINGGKPFGVRGELYEALTCIRELVSEVRDMQSELDTRASADRLDKQS